MIQYVTYDEDGNLTGFYIQELRPEHANAYIIVTDEDVRGGWVFYRANAARDGIEKIPVDVSPDDPVQSGW